VAGKPPEVGFKVRPDGRKGRDYYQVVIHRDRKAMHAAHREEKRRDGEPQAAFRKPKYEALASYNDYRLRRHGRALKLRAPLRGYVRFHVGALGSGIVAHEMTHAALYWLWYDKRIKPSPARTSTDERLATTVGEMVRQFWSGFYRLKERGVQWVPSWREGMLHKIGHARFTHGNTTTKYHAAKMAADYGSCVFYGHTHQIQEHHLLLRGKNRTIKAKSCGHLADETRLRYMRGKPTSWQQSLTVLCVFPSGDFRDFTASIFGGRFIGPLDGKVYG